MTDREKIIEIIAPFISAYGEDEAIADALIAANIGDVKEAKFECDHYWRMWQGALVELERAERRAEIAERKYMIAFNKYAKCDRKLTHYNKMTTTYDKEITKQAEKELAEEGQ